MNHSINLQQFFFHVIWAGPLSAAQGASEWSLTTYYSGVYLSSDHYYTITTITKCDSFLLQSVTNNITKCDRYCKVRRLILQSATEDPGPPLISVSRNGLHLLPRLPFSWQYPQKKLNIFWPKLHCQFHCSPQRRVAPLCRPLTVASPPPPPK